MTLIQKRGLRPLWLLTLMTEFSVLIAVKGIAPGNSWLGGVSLKDYKILSKNNTIFINRSPSKTKIGKDSWYINNSLLCKPEFSSTSKTNLFY